MIKPDGCLGCVYDQFLECSDCVRQHDGDGKRDEYVPTKEMKNYEQKVRDATIKWNIITSHPMDDEEREYFRDTDVDYVLENIPDDGEECLLSNGTIDVFSNEGEYGCYWEDSEDVAAGQKWIAVKDVIGYLDRQMGE